MTESGTTKSGKSSTYNRGFEQHLTDHRVHVITRKSQKADLGKEKTALVVPRPSLSPSRVSNGAFEAFQETADQAKDEGDVINYVIPIVAGSRKANYPSANSMVFGNLEPLTDGTIPAPTPDIALGALPEQLHPSIRHELQHHIVPSTTSDRLLAPNFFVKVKGPDESALVMRRQARYDGAVGSRAMHSLQNYGREEAVYDGQAYTYTSTYFDGILHLYANYTTAPATEGDRPEYHMTVINSYALIGDRKTFIKGATAYRNLRDLAKEHRDTFIRNANARYQRTQETSITIAASSSEDDPNADELAYTLQASQSIVTASEPAARLPPSVTSSSSKGKSRSRHTTSSSKRPKNSHSPPYSSSRPEKQESERRK